MKLFSFLHKKPAAEVNYRYAIGDLLLSYMVKNNGCATSDGYYGLFEKHNIPEIRFNMTIHLLKHEDIIAPWSSRDQDNLVLTIKGEEASRIRLQKYFSIHNK
jgi:hypothetical protein